VLNASTLSTASQGLSRGDEWFEAIRGALLILRALSSTSSHLMVRSRVRSVNLSAVSIFPYLLRCVPYPQLALESVQWHGFIRYAMRHFTEISNAVVDAAQLLEDEQFIASDLKPSVEALSSILQCFVSMAQKSLDGALSLYCDLMLFLRNCSIFKSTLGHFVEPYFGDSGEENPCHELWCHSLLRFGHFEERGALLRKDAVRRMLQNV